jgi:hypothetical protein
MSKKSFTFDLKEFSYQDIEQFCINKWFKIEKDFKSNIEYSDYIRNSRLTLYIINKYIFLLQPAWWKDIYPEIQVDLLESLENKKRLHLNAEYLGRWKEEKKDEYEQAKIDYQTLKKEIDKVYNSLKRKFWSSKKHLDELEKLNTPNAEDLSMIEKIKKMIW